MKKKIIINSMITVMALSAPLTFSASPALTSVAYAAEQTQQLDVSNIEYEDGVITFTMNQSIDESKGLWAIIDGEDIYSGKIIANSVSKNTISVKVGNLEEGRNYYISTVNYDGSANISMDITDYISELNEMPTLENISSVDSLSKRITGTTNPGDTVQLLNSSDMVLGEAVADSTGSFELEFESQSYDSELTLKSINTFRTVQENIIVKAVKGEAPKVNEISHEDKSISGMALPGAMVMVETNSGTNQVIALGYANNDGSFSLNTIADGKLMSVDEVKVYYYYDGLQSEPTNVSIY